MILTLATDTSMARASTIARSEEREKMAVETLADGTIIVDGPDVVNVYRPLAMYHALKLEIKGLSFKSGSVYAMVRREYGFKGSKAKVLDQLEAKLKKDGILKERRG